ncbi:hypothetical protein GCM10015535_51610 [Streptomyces gelaticus]|uniref:Uncharacterized protein n=1 Tax=Streptomyces gelaticus TaxID=285446 RepID=A0ABQ2W4A2_9ACTN|nr:hypothetical protein GCM10015535_51610 [Streptomyces gelaticus]
MVGEGDVTGVVQGPCREDRGTLVGTGAPAEHRADRIRVAAVEGGDAGVLGVARIPADAESKTPAIDGESAPAGAGAEAGGALAWRGVLLVVVGGESTIAAQDQDTGRGSGHHSGTGIGAGPSLVAE